MKLSCFTQTYSNDNPIKNCTGKNSHSSYPATGPSHSSPDQHAHDMLEYKKHQNSLTCMAQASKNRMIRFFRDASRPIANWTGACYPFVQQKIKGVVSFGNEPLHLDPILLNF